MLKNRTENEQNYKHLKLIRLFFFLGRTYQTNKNLEIETAARISNILSERGKRISCIFPFSAIKLAFIDSIHARILFI